MDCPNCSNEVPADAGFCPSCGADVRAARAAETEAATPASAPVTDESGRWVWDAASGQWVAASTVLGADQTAALPAAGGPTQPKKTSTGMVIGIVAAALVGLLFLCGIAGFGAYWFSTTRGKTTTTATAIDGGPVTMEPTSTATAGATSPDSAVDAWYKAVASGDMAAIRKTSTPEWAAKLEPGMFEGRDPTTSYRIVSSSLPPNGGQVGDTDSVDVEETRAGQDAGTAVTFSVLKTENGWLISGLTETATGESAIRPPPAAITPARPAGLSKDQAIDVVGRFLDAQKNGRNSEMKKLVTSRYLKDDPGKFEGDASEAFIQFEVVKAVKKGDTWLVTTSEQWISGPENPTYYVVYQGGKGLVDNETYPQ